MSTPALATSRARSGRALVGGTALAIALCSFAAAATHSPVAVLGLAAAAAIPAAAAASPHMRELLLGAVLFDVMLQWDRNFAYQKSAGALGAEAGLNVSLTTFAVVGLYALWAADRARPQPSMPPPRLRPGLPLLAYIGLGALSIVWARDAALGVDYLLLLAQTFLVFLYIASTVRTRRDVLFVVTGLLAAVVLESLLILFIHVTGFSFNVAGLDTRSALDEPPGAQVTRAVGTLGSPNTAGGLLALLLPVALAVLAAPVPRRLRRLAVAALVSGVPALVLTGSRGAWVSLLLSGVVLGTFAIRRGFVSPRAVIRTALVIVVLSLPVATVVILRVSHESPGASHARVVLAELAVKMVQDRPLVGVGLNNVPVRLPDFAGPQFTGDWLYNIHTKYLLVAAESGLPALAAFLWFLGATIARGLRCVRAADRLVAAVGLGLLAGVLGQMVHMSVDLFVNRAAVQGLWVVAALIAALAAMAGPARGEGRRP